MGSIRGDGTAYFNVVCRQESDHGVVFPFVPVLVDLAAQIDDIALLE